MSNEAAERLRSMFPAGGGYAGGNNNIRAAINEALAAERLSAEVDCIKRVRKEVAAERRATVERIRERLTANAGMPIREVHAILDEEAAR